MGYHTMRPEDWEEHAAKVRTSSTSAIFTKRGMKKTGDPRTTFDPLEIPFRESRDSDKNPNSTPIIIALDVTGSMHKIPTYMVKEGLGPTFEHIYDRQPVSDPHIMFMAIGDADYGYGHGDTAPLQATQFESDIVLAQQLADIYLEGGGGGNMSESYTLAWYFAATRTRCDCIDKGRRKGILFTIGDEMVNEVITPEAARRVLGDDLQAGLTAKQLYAMVSKDWDVFHFIIEQGDNYRAYPEEVRQSWRDILGQRAILVKDYTKLCEIMISTLQLLKGEDLNKVATSWENKNTELVVRHALGGFMPLARGPAVPGKPRKGARGVVRFNADA